MGSLNDPEIIRANVVIPLVSLMVFLLVDWLVLLLMRPLVGLLADLKIMRTDTVILLVSLVVSLLVYWLVTLLVEPLIRPLEDSPEMV